MDRLDQTAGERTQSRFGSNERATARVTQTNSLGLRLRHAVLPRRRSSEKVLVQFEKSRAEIEHFVQLSKQKIER